MICTERFAFIHVPKTGGMSVTRYLINAVDEPVAVFALERGRQHALDMATTPDRAQKLRFVAGKRHETPAEAVAAIRGADLPVPPWAFAVIRHPVDLMLSYYKHMRKPWIWKQRGMDADSLTGDVKLAMEADFGAFCRETGFYALDDAGLARFYEPAGFDRLDIVPLNRLPDYLALKFSGQGNATGATLEHRNKSRGGMAPDTVPEETRALIATRYPTILRLYEEAAEATW